MVFIEEFWCLYFCFRWIQSLVIQTPRLAETLTNFGTLLRKTGRTLTRKKNLRVWRVGGVSVRFNGELPPSDSVVSRKPTKQTPMKQTHRIIGSLAALLFTTALAAFAGTDMSNMSGPDGKAGKELTPFQVGVHRSKHAREQFQGAIGVAYVAPLRRQPQACVN